MAKILYLEDEKWQIEHSVCTRLEIEFGHEITIVKNLKDAIAILNHVDFDVIIVDIMLNPRNPITYETSGFALLSRLLKEDSGKGTNALKYRVVVATGVLDKSATSLDGSRISVANGLAALGIADKQCVKKPFSAEELNDAISIALHNGA